MASGPITSWEIDGETVETVSDFILGGSRITAHGDCSHKIKTLTPWKKNYDHPRQHIKSRDITLPTTVCLVKAMVFPVVMYGCKSWTIKKAEVWRIDAFELWCWRRLLMLKLQYFGHLIWRTDSLQKTLRWERLRAWEKGDDRGWEMVRCNYWAAVYRVAKSWTWLRDWTKTPINKERIL